MSNGVDLTTLFLFIQMDVSKEVRVGEEVGSDCQPMNGEVYKPKSKYG